MRNVGIFLLGMVLSIPVVVALTITNGNMGQDKWPAAFMAGVFSFYVVFAMFPLVAIFVKG